MAFNPASTSFDAANALYLALASELAYFDPEPIKANLQRILGIPGDAQHLLTFQRGDTEGFVAADDQKIILAYRGSEAPKSPDGIQDWLRNFSAVPVELSHYANNGPFNAQVHEGFANGVHNVIAPIVNALWKLDAGRNLPLFITGHSLGGALALINAIIFTYDSHLKRPIQGLYTYGQPRAAGPGLCTNFGREIGGRYQRIVNNLDIVPRVPTRPFYEHVGEIQWFNGNGDLNPPAGLTHENLMKDEFASLISGHAGGNPFATIFNSLGGSLVEPVCDHLLRDKLFGSGTNPGSYLVKLAKLAGTPLPPPPQ
ncbi:MAG: lipase family protein [Chthoniobacteraceae bacterium]